HEAVRVAARPVHHGDARVAVHRCAPVGPFDESARARAAVPRYARTASRSGAMRIWEVPLAVLGGSVAGIAVFLIIRELMPATPALAPTLARLQPRIEAPTIGLAEPSLGAWGWLARVVPVPASDLSILGKRQDAYLTSVATSAISGLIAPGVLAVLLALAGIHIPFFIPVILGLLGAMLFALLARRDVGRKATDARRDFNRAFCSYLDLVVLELTAAGPVQALEAAAKICHGWAFDRIDEALTQAQLQMTF